MNEYSYFKENGKFYRYNKRQKPESLSDLTKVEITELEYSKKIKK